MFSIKFTRSELDVWAQFCVFRARGESKVGSRRTASLRERLLRSVSCLHIYSGMQPRIEYFVFH